MLAVALHGELLEVGREPLEVLIVGQHGHRLGAEEVPVPHGEEAHEDGQVLCEGRRPEVLVHGVKAGQQLARKFSGPIASMVERPMAESIE